jgi:hypothetical protein
MSNRTTIQLDTLADLNNCFASTGIVFTRNYGCAVKIYDNRSRLTDEFNSNAYLPNIYLNEQYYGFKDNFIKLFNTPNQYIASLHYWLMDFNHKHQYDKYKPIVSFMEVWHGDVFIARHFIRKWQLFPLMSEIQDRSQCPYLRLPLVSDKPILDWQRIKSDAYWGRVKQPMKDYVKTIKTNNPRPTIR